MLGLGVLLALSVLSSRATTRTGVPLTLVFLAIGMLAGSEGIGGIAFSNYTVAMWLGIAALSFILFDGGLNTSVGSIRGVIGPSAVLATAGVVLTAGAMALIGAMAGLDWSTAWMIGAIVSSTDAAAVFSVLRASGVHLKRRVGMTLEMESGLNDPVAVIVTAVVLNWVVQGQPPSLWGTASGVVWQLGAGLLLGWAAGRLGRWALQRYPLRPSGLVPAFTIALASLAYAVPSLVNASGFLAVYVAGIVLLAVRVPYQLSVQRVHDTLAWLGQISMFLVLGLLAFPSRILQVWPLGVGLALALACIARPLVTALCLVPFGYNRREIAFIGWVGLRGAVPIVLATFPVILGAPRAEFVFDVVFVIVVVNAVVQGMSVPWAARRFRVDSAEPVAPAAVLEIEGPAPFEREIRSYTVDEALPVIGASLHALPLPDTVTLMLVIRQTKLLTPHPDLLLEPGDHVYLLVAELDAPYVQLLFGVPESG
jgi:potassium/hydrogen antiporter